MTTLLPTRLGFGGSDTGSIKSSSWRIGYDLTRYRCENAVLLGAVAWGIWTLGDQWDERALAGGMSRVVSESRAVLIDQKSDCSSVYQSYTARCASGPSLG